jgi:dienelactone hydrolase
MRRRQFFALVQGVTILIACVGCVVVANTRTVPATVSFASADGHTELVGYVFEPQTKGPHPAVVMLHGRTGPYSSRISKGCTLVAKDNDSPCNATSLSKRHVAWGTYWADRGYVALLPDSFGPRNQGHGFERFTHGDPDRDDVNERTVRPLDAEGALRYLQSRDDVVPGQVFLQGWSNGASTALNVMYRQTSLPSGFRAAMAFYPGCGPGALLSQDYKTGQPVTVFLASDDEEVSPAVCHEVLDATKNNGSPITLIDYPGATHDFDWPGKKRQSVEANRTAREDVLRRASEVFAN